MDPSWLQLTDSGKSTFLIKCGGVATLADTPEVCCAPSCTLASRRKRKKGGGGGEEKS